MMFPPDAEEHYFGSIVMTNPKLSTLGTSIIIKNKNKRDFQTFLCDSNIEDTRRTLGTKSPYVDTRLNNIANSNRRSASLGKQDALKNSTFTLTRPNSNTEMLVSKNGRKEEFEVSVRIEVDGGPLISEGSPTLPYQSHFTNNVSRSPVTNSQLIHTENYYDTKR
jgi:hypothetical protein